MWNKKNRNLLCRLLVSLCLIVALSRPKANDDDSDWKVYLITTENSPERKFIISGVNLKGASSSIKRWDEGSKSRIYTIVSLDDGVSVGAIRVEATDYLHQYRLLNAEGQPIDRRFEVPGTTDGEDVSQPIRGNQPSPFFWNLLPSAVIQPFYWMQQLPRSLGYLSYIPSALQNWWHRGGQYDPPSSSHSNNRLSNSLYINPSMTGTLDPEKRQVGTATSNTDQILDLALLEAKGYIGSMELDTPNTQALQIVKTEHGWRLWINLALLNQPVQFFLPSGLLFYPPFSFIGSEQAGYYPLPDVLAEFTGSEPPIIPEGVNSLSDVALLAYFPRSDNDSPFITNIWLARHHIPTTDETTELPQTDFSGYVHLTDQAFAAHGLQTHNDDTDQKRYELSKKLKTVFDENDEETHKAIQLINKINQLVKLDKHTISLNELTDLMTDLRGLFNLNNEYDFRSANPIRETTGAYTHTFTVKELIDDTLLNGFCAVTSIVSRALKINDIKIPYRERYSCNIVNFISMFLPQWLDKIKVHLNKKKLSYEEILIDIEKVLLSAETFMNSFGCNKSIYYPTFWKDMRTILIFCFNSKNSKTFFMHTLKAEGHMVDYEISSTQKFMESAANMRDFDVIFILSRLSDKVQDKLNKNELPEADVTEIKKLYETGWKGLKPLVKQERNNIFVKKLTQFLEKAKALGLDIKDGQTALDNYNKQNEDRQQRWIRQNALANKNADLLLESCKQEQEREQKKQDTLFRKKIVTHKKTSPLLRNQQAEPSQPMVASKFKAETRKTPENIWQDYYDRGLDAFLKKQNDQARTLFKETLEKSPGLLQQAYTRLAIADCYLADARSVIGKINELKKKLIIFQTLSYEALLNETLPAFTRKSFRTLLDDVINLTGYWAQNVNNANKWYQEAIDELKSLSSVNTANEVVRDQTIRLLEAMEGGNSEIDKVTTLLLHITNIMNDIREVRLITLSIWRQTHWSTPLELRINEVKCFKKLDNIEKSLRSTNEKFTENKNIANEVLRKNFNQLHKKEAYPGISIKMTRHAKIIHLLNSARYRIVDVAKDHYCMYSAIALWLQRHEHTSVPSDSGQALYHYMIPFAQAMANQHDDDSRTIDIANAFSEGFRPGLWMWGTDDMIQLLFAPNLELDFLILSEPSEDEHTEIIASLYSRDGSLSTVGEEAIAQRLGNGHTVGLYHIHNHWQVILPDSTDVQESALQNNDHTGLNSSFETDDSSPLIENPDESFKMIPGFLPLESH